MTAGHETTIIASLQEEIAAAQKKRATLSGQNWYGMDENSQAEYNHLGGYIQGLKQALYLQTRQPVRELEF